MKPERARLNFSDPVFLYLVIVCFLAFKSAAVSAQTIEPVYQFHLNAVLNTLKMGNLPIEPERLSRCIPFSDSTWSYYNSMGSSSDRERSRAFYRLEEKLYQSVAKDTALCIRLFEMSGFVSGDGGASYFAHITFLKSRNRSYFDYCLDRCDPKKVRRLRG